MGKGRGSDRNGQKMSEFGQAVDSVELVDLGFHVPSFTWCNGRAG